MKFAFFFLKMISKSINICLKLIKDISKIEIKKGIKISCTHFQYAAWAFQQVRDVYSDFDLAEDCSADIMLFKMNVMMAQAQECVLEKSIVDGRKPSINAKVCAQCVEYYKLALNNLEKPSTSSLMGSRKTKVNINYLLLFCLHSTLFNVFSSSFYFLLKRNLSNMFSSS